MTYAWLFVQREHSHQAVRNSVVALCYQTAAHALSFKNIQANRCYMDRRVHSKLTTIPVHLLSYHRNVRVDPCAAAENFALLTVENDVYI
jgi:hypothetical protein